MSEELIKKSDAIDAIEVVDWYHQNKNKDMVSGANSDEHQAWYKADDVYKALEATPTIEPKTKVIAQVTFDEEKLREIVKEAVERFKEEYEIADRPQGEWNPYYTKRENNDIFNCKLCGTTFIVMQGKDNMNFCPNCGIRMKGAEDEVLRQL